jgi:beta-lactamase superfamily II metal-dependent hydrolase
LHRFYLIVFHLKYGFFDFFSGGDIQYGGRSTHSWLDIELPISKVLGKLEVMKASHHGTANTNSQELLNAAKPEHVVIGVWNSVQPNPDTIKRFLKANSKTRFFLTNLTDENRKTLTDDGVDLSVFSATGGHIVVRVAPGGRKYRIYVLDDTNQDYKVKAILGPYTAQ